MTTSCYIYRCSAKLDMYIYLSKENDFDCIDDSIKKKLGTLDYAMVLEIKDDTKLAKEDPKKIIENLKSQGFHLQLPSETSIEELMAKFNKSQNK
jgi:uncharacterized protein